MLFRLSAVESQLDRCDPCVTRSCRKAREVWAQDARARAAARAVSGVPGTQRLVWRHVEVIRTASTDDEAWASVRALEHLAATRGRPHA